MFRDFFYYHYMVENDSKKIPINPQYFVCKCCDYLTYSSKDFKKHNETIKHKRRTNGSNDSEKIPKNPNSQNISIFVIAVKYINMIAVFIVIKKHVI